VNDITVTVHHLLEKCQNYAFCLCCGRLNSFAMSMVESQSALSLCTFKTVRLLNRSLFMLELSHVFSLRAVEKDLSPAAALVAGFTRIT